MKFIHTLTLYIKIRLQFLSSTFYTQKHEENSQLSVVDDIRSSISRCMIEMIKIDLNALEVKFNLKVRVSKVMVRELEKREERDKGLEIDKIKKCLS